MERSDRQCILCNGMERTLLLRQEEWTIYKCKNCGLGFLDPRPDQAERGRLYQDSYFLSHYDRGLPIDSPEMKRRLSQENHRIRFFRNVKRQGRGYFLHACRLIGYDVQGIELSSDSSAYVRDELKIPIITGEIEALHIENGSFDIVTMWHFLEHTPNPGLYLKKARQWLKADGILIVDVPNHEGVDARKMGPSWREWSIPYHLYHFTPTTLISLLSQYGFRVIRQKTYLSEYIEERIERIPLASLFARPIARCFSGHSIAVLARQETINAEARQHPEKT